MIATSCCTPMYSSGVPEQVAVNEKVSCVQLFSEKRILSQLPMYSVSSEEKLVQGGGLLVCTGRYLVPPKNWESTFINALVDLYFKGFKIWARHKNWVIYWSLAVLDLYLDCVQIMRKTFYTFSQRFGIQEENSRVTWYLFDAFSENPIVVVPRQESR